MKNSILRAVAAGLISAAISISAGVHADARVLSLSGASVVSAPVTLAVADATPTPQAQLQHDLRKALDSSPGRALLAAAREQRADGDPYDFSTAAGWTPLIAAAGQYDPETTLRVVQAARSTQKLSDDVIVQLIGAAITSDPGLAAGFFRRGEPGSGERIHRLIEASLQNNTIVIRTTIDQANTDPTSKDAFAGLRTALQTLLPSV